MSVGRISGPLLRSNLQRTDDLAFETDLLYINHSGNKIGIRTDAPTRTLQVNGTTRNTASIIATNSATFGNMMFENASISALTGPISITAGSSIQTPQLRVGDVYFNNNILGTYTSNTDLQLEANAAGYVDIPSNLEVYGSINATGNILADGNIVIGDDSTDSLTIGADISSDIIPDLNTTYNIGSSFNRQWANTFAAAGDVAGNIAVSSLVSIGGITVNLPIDNTYYVSSLGSDTNPGQTVSFAFATVEKALLEAAAAGGNNLIHILPGTYTEDFPLTLPANTTIRGSSLRAVKIQPTTSTQSEDAFLLNNGCMITDITVANFYYDNLNDTGYGFRFVNNINITAKSPYVQNVSVITQGSITSGSDPRGFNAGDAGKGALVDGSVANSASNQASMLFNAVTFITPGVDAITMKNGVRVEFIDCFTYFANRSLYAINGAAGFASLGTVFGAEVRAIASASVYGNKGAEADGDETLMYLINHNMAYVGAGKDVTNDRSLAVQSLETVELNSGRIYYQSQDHDGNFRVGDTFSVDFSTGFINLNNLVPVAFTGSSLTVGLPGSQTYIDGERIILPNFTVSGNTIKSDINQVDIASASGTINFLTNTNISVDLSVTGDLTVGGSLINLGNQVTDTIDFEMEFTSDIIPAVDNVYNLGQGSGGSLTFSSSNYLSLSTAQTIGTQPFTFECFFYTASNGLQTLLGATSAGAMSIWLLGDGINPVTIIQIDRSGVDNAQYTVSPITTNTWHHIAVTRDSSNNMSVFLDGVKATGSTSNATDYTAPSGLIGAVAGSAYYFTGYLTQIKLAVGSNYYNPTASSISVPTTSLTISANTKLLLTVATSGAYLTDNSGTQTISNIGVVAYSTVSPFTTLNWDNVYTRQFNVGDITITDNYIAVNQSNLDLIVQANGTGRVVVDNLRFKSIVDSTAGNINIANSTRTSNFTGKAIQLPTGNAAQRPAVAADLRYNTVSGQFEGYNTNVVLLGGVKDLDGDTRIELNSDQFYFYANGVNTGRIDTAGNLIVNRFHSQSQFALDNNTVTVGSATAGTVAALTANGTGVVRFDTSNYVFNNGSIRNTGTNSDIQFQMTGVQKEQYVHWSANGTGVRLPYGSTLQRNPGVIGELYWNTTLQLLQVYDGTVWGNAAGVSGTIVPQSQVEEINVIYELILA